MSISMRGLIFGALALLLPTLATAQTIPGADDPRLRAAVQAWLQAGDPTDAIQDLGQIAAEGNNAARLFMNRIVVEHLTFDYPDLSHKERMAILPPDKTETDTRRSSRRPYPAPDPLATLEGQLTSRKSESHLTAAQKLLEIGAEDFLRVYILTVPENIPEIDIEAVKWAEGWLTYDDPEKTGALLLRIFDQIRLEGASKRKVNDSFSERLDRWDGQPWNDQIGKEFSEAVSEGRWVAIELAISKVPQILPVTAAGIDHLNQLDDWHSAASAVLNYERDGTSLGSSDFESLGQAILEDAPRSPFLWPLRTICQEHCAGELNYCMAAGALGNLDRSKATKGLYPLVTLEEYYASRRLVRLVLGSLGLSRNHPDERLAKYARDRSAFFPQCLLDAADSLTPQGFTQ